MPTEEKPLYVWDFAATGWGKHAFKSTGNVRNDNQTLCGRQIQRAPFTRRIKRPVICLECEALGNRLP